MVMEKHFVIATISTLFFFFFFFLWGVFSRVVGVRHGEGTNRKDPHHFLRSVPADFFWSAINTQCVCVRVGNEVNETTTGDSY